jgi:RNA binding activity-knot of a chromodomain
MQIGAPLVARFVDGTARLATVIERSCTAAGVAANAAAAAAAAAAGAVPTAALPQPQPAEAWRYYLHFTGMNRRMDEWVGHERIISPPSVAAAELKAQKEAKVAVKKEGGDAPYGGPTDDSADPSRARRCVCFVCVHGYKCCIYCDQFCSSSFRMLQ